MQNKDITLDYQNGPEPITLHSFNDLEAITFYYEINLNHHIRFTKWLVTHHIRFTGWLVSLGEIINSKILRYVQNLQHPTIFIQWEK